MLSRARVKRNALPARLSKPFHPTACASNAKGIAALLSTLAERLASDKYLLQHTPCKRTSHQVLKTYSNPIQPCTHVITVDIWPVRLRTLPSWYVSLDTHPRSRSQNCSDASHLHNKNDGRHVPGCAQWDTEFEVFCLRLAAWHDAVGSLRVDVL